MFCQQIGTNVTVEKYAILLFGVKACNDAHPVQLEADMRECKRCTQLVQHGKMIQRSRGQHSITDAASLACPKQQDGSNIRMQCDAKAHNLRLQHTLALLSASNY